MTADLIVFGEDWGRHPSSTQHLVKRLAADRRVIWINSIGLRRPRLRPADLKRIVQKLRAVLFGGSRRWRPGRARARSGEPDGRGPDGDPLAGQSAGGLAQPVSARPPDPPGHGGAQHRAAGALGLAADRRRSDGRVRRARDDLLLRRRFRPSGRRRSCTGDRGGKRGSPPSCDRILAVSPALAAKFPAAKTLMLPHGADIALVRRSGAARRGSAGRAWSRASMVACRPGSTRICWPMSRAAYPTGPSS